MMIDHGRSLEVDMNTAYLPVINTPRRVRGLHR